MDIGGVQATQAIELASSMSPSFIRDKSSAGLVGLAFSSINQVKPTQQKTFFDTVQNDLAQPVFTAALKDGTPGSYAFGRIDYPTPLNFIPVDSSQGFWQFASSSFKVGDDPTVIPNKDNSPAIADTGTSLLLADKSVVTGYYSKVTGAINDDSQGGWIYPCVSTMPALSIALGDSQYGSIPANLLTYASLNTTRESFPMLLLRCTSADSMCRLLWLVAIEQWPGISDLRGYPLQGHVRCLQYQGQDHCFCSSYLRQEVGPWALGFGISEAMLEHEILAGDESYQ